MPKIANLRNSYVLDEAIGSAIVANSGRALDYWSYSFNALVPPSTDYLTIDCDITINNNSALNNYLWRIVKNDYLTGFTINRVLNPPSRDDMANSTIFNDKFISSILRNVNGTGGFSNSYGINVFDINFSSSPYQPGAMSVDYSVDISSLLAGNSIINDLIEFPDNRSNLSIGQLWVNPSTFEYSVAVVGNNSGIYNNVFELGAEQNLMPASNITLSDDIYLYSIITWREAGITSIYHIDWNLGGYSNKGLASLSVSADNDKFQELYNLAGLGQAYLCANKDYYIFTFVSTYPATDIIAFVVAKDWSYYDRYEFNNLTFNGNTLADGNLFIDINNNIWISGYTAIDFTTSVNFLYSTFIEAPLFTRNPFPIKMECGNYCIPLFKQRKKYS